MTELAIATRSIVIEREMPHPPERVWRALTQSVLMAEWLMPNDFQPIIGHNFNFRSQPIAGWNSVADRQVLVCEPPHRLAWSQNASGEQAATGLRSVVTWTPTRTGVLRAHGALGLQAAR